jgi:hypothetical protein
LLGGGGGGKGEGLQIVRTGEGKLEEAADGHRHEGPRDAGGYGRNLTESDLATTAKRLRDGPIQYTTVFSVAPSHFWDRNAPTGIDYSDPNHVTYYLRLGEDGERELGTIELKGDKAIVKGPAGHEAAGLLGAGNQPALQAGDWNRDRIVRALGGRVRPGDQTIHFVSTPDDYVLGYVGPEGDEEAIELIAKRIRYELDHEGHSITSERVSLGIVAGDPYDPASCDLVWKALAFAKTMEDKYQIPPGSIRMYGASEETISKEAVTPLVGMPTYARVGQPGLDAISQAFAPYRFMKAPVYVHCDSGGDLVIYDPVTEEGVSPDRKDINIPIIESDLANIPNLEKLLKQNPDQIFIWAHFGASYTTTMPKGYVQLLDRLLTENPNLRLDTSWLVSVDWIRIGGNRKLPKDLVDRAQVRQFAQLIAKHPKQIFYGSDVVGGSVKPGDDPAVAVLRAQDQIGLLKEITLAGNQHGIPDLLERYQLGNYQDIVGVGADNVKMFRTDDLVAQWLAAGAPGGVPPKQIVQDANGAYRLVPTADLGPSGNLNTQILPPDARPMVNVPGIVWSPKRGPGPKNPFRMGPLNLDRRKLLAGQGVVFDPD